MNNIRLDWINYALFGIIIFLAALALLFTFLRPSHITVVEKVSEKTKLPQNAFAQSTERYESIGPPFLSLDFSPMALQVPDLKRYLIYYGRNDRPDASVENMKLNFGLNGVKGIVSASIKEPIYLVYDKNDPKTKYKFSPGNAVTTLWFDATPATMPGDVVVSAAMTNEAGEVVRQPEANAEFNLKEKPQPRDNSEERKIGEFRVDGTLLSRQGAKWYGTDKFMERHGGEEYKDFIGKQRIDFGTGDSTYSVYVGPEDALVWVNDRWKQEKPSKETRKYPMIAINKIEDRIMKLDFWDVDGRGKMALNLIKSQEAWVPQSIQKEFNFIGARTRSQFLFEINNERMTLSPSDWLIRTDEGWKKLTTSQEIDDYVDRRIVGPLFVFDGVEKIDGKQVLVGTLFNKTRTDMKTIEVVLQQGGAPMMENREPSEKRSLKRYEEPEDSEGDDEDEATIKEKIQEKLKEMREMRNINSIPPEPRGKRE